MQPAGAEFNARFNAAEKREMATEPDTLMEAYVAQALALNALLEAMEEQYEYKDSNQVSANPKKRIKTGTGIKPVPR